MEKSHSYFASKEEINTRILSLQTKLEHCDLPGCLILDNINTFYYTGTMQNGALFVPEAGDPIFFIRRSLERGKHESPLKRLLRFQKFKEIPPALDSYNYDFSRLGIDESTTPLRLFNMLEQAFPATTFSDISFVLAEIRAVKSVYEIAQIREAGHRHEKVYAAIPDLVREGMTEWELGTTIFCEMLKLDSMGTARMAGFNGEVFGGYICFGESGNYPCAFDGPGGLVGQSPAFPLLGGDRRLKRGDIIYVDTGFGYNGYYTDKTRIFSMGEPESEAVEAHNICLAIQEKVRALLKPGIRPSEIFELVYDEIVIPKNFKLNFMGFGGNRVRFLGHGIGLVIDEFPAIAKKIDYPLKKNMVIAVEPKKGLEGIGLVGIENTFLVTSEGGARLTPGSDEITIL
ncbi:MAG: Xaa-Pro peptidase family protein [Pseudomonadota bacterium]